jgi:O-antigen ligase
MLKKISLFKEKNWHSYLFYLFCGVLPWSLAAMQIAVILLVIVSVVHSVLHKRAPVKYHPFFIFVFFYLLTQATAAFFSPDIMISFKAFFHTDWFILTLPFILAIPLSEEERLTSVHILLGSAALVAIYGLIQFFGGIEYFRGEEMNKMGNFFRAEGGYNFYLTFAGNQLMIFGIGFSFYLFEKRWTYTKIFYFATVGFIFLSIIASFARSTWIPLLLIVLIGSWIINRHFFGLITAGTIIIGFVTSFLSPEIYERLISIFDPTKNLGRINLWKTSWAMFSDHKIFGIGQGLFNEFFPRYKVPGYYDAAGHAHNDYLNFAVISGLVGLCGWLMMWASWFYFTVKTAKNNMNWKPEIQILTGSILGISGILLASFFQCYYTDLENNILWWTIAVFSILIVNQKN